METDTKPVAHKPCPALYHLQKPLDQGVKEKIIEKLPHGEAITWCSTLVAHPRENGEVERFLQTLHKTEQIASLQGKNHLDRRNAYPLQISTAPSYRSCPVQSPPPVRAN